MGAIRDEARAKSEALAHLYDLACRPAPELSIEAQTQLAAYSRELAMRRRAFLGVLHEASEAEAPGEAGGERGEGLGPVPGNSPF